MNAKSLIFVYCVLAVVATCLCIFAELTQTAQTVDVPALNDVPVVVPTPPKIVAQNVSQNVFPSINCFSPHDFREP